MRRRPRQAMAGGPPAALPLRIREEAQLAVEAVAHGRGGNYSALADDGATSSQARTAAMLLSAATQHLDEEPAARAS